MAITGTDPTLGIAFGGGAIRGFAHLGVLAALHEQGDPRLVPTVVAGTSTGSVMGALYAAGLSVEDILAEARRFGWLSHIVGFRKTIGGVLRDVAHAVIPRSWRARRRYRGGLLSSGALGRWIDGIMQRRLGGCSFDAIHDVRLAAVATEIERKQRVVLTSSDLVEKVRGRLAASPRPVISVVTDACPTVGTAVRASAAMPGLFEAVEVDDMRLLDGGGVDQVPVEVAFAMGADVVVGVSLGMVQFFRPASSPVKSFMNFIEVLSREQIQNSLRLANACGVGFEIPGIEETSLLDTRHLDGLVNMGREAMSAHMDELKAGLARESK